MGQGGHLAIMNATKEDWIKENQTSNQMNDWDFPDIIPSGRCEVVYIEWNQSIMRNQHNDKGRVSYKNSAGQSFVIEAEAINQFNITVLFHSCDNLTNDKIDLGWKHDGYLNLFIAGTDNNYWSNNSSVNSWMNKMLPYISNLSLKNLCIPGSHDSGMFMNNDGTIAPDCSVITQSKSIYDQLEQGIRYFDVRPIIGSGKFYSGHYSNTTIGWLGGRGQSIDSIIDDINKFTKLHNELIILNVSHDLNTDDKYRKFDDNEWDAFLKQMNKLNYLFKVDTQEVDIDLSKSKLSTFIGKGQSSVIVIMESGSNNLGDYFLQGFFTKKHLNVYNEYSNTNNLDIMSNDQLTKMEYKAIDNNSEMFLLSWTLTQSDSQASTCMMPGIPSIKTLANSANNILPSTLFSKCSCNLFPNIVYVDNVIDNNIALLCCSIIFNNLLIKD